MIGDIIMNIYGYIITINSKFFLYDIALTRRAVNLAISYTFHTLTVEEFKIPIVGSTFIISASEVLNNYSIKKCYSGMKSAGS